MTRHGTLLTIDGQPALRFERRYRHPIERVWRAISEPAEMSRWFPSDVEGEREVGAELLFVDDDQRAAAREAGEPTRADGPLWQGRVVAHDPPNVFSFTWGGELLRFELTPDGDHTLLVFTHLLSHPSVAARTGAGWHACLAELDDLLDVTGGVAGDEWPDVFDDYLQRMGPELGVPATDGSMTWERATHVDDDQVRRVTSDETEMKAWGGEEHAGEPVRWDITPVEHGTVYRLTHEAIGENAALAATWHALLVQLDMYLATGEGIPVEPGPWVEAYRRRLGS